MENLEIAIRTERAWQKVYSILQHSGSDVEHMREGLREVAKIVGNEVPGNSGVNSNVLQNLTMFTDSQIPGLYNKWTHDAKICGAFTEKVVRELRRMRRPWWKFW